VNAGNFNAVAAAAAINQSSAAITPNSTYYNGGKAVETKPSEFEGSSLIGLTSRGYCESVYPRGIIFCLLLEGSPGTLLSDLCTRSL
jgi:hypothetical protein